MKKIISLLLAALTLLILAACTSTEVNPKTTETQTEKPSTLTSTTETPTTETSTTPVVTVTPTNTTTVSATTTPTTEPTPEDKPVTFVKDGEKITVSIDLPEYAGAEASVILLKDQSAKDTWQTTETDKLIDLSQVSLDENGQASVALVSHHTGSAYLLVTVGDGEYGVSVE